MPRGPNTHCFRKGQSLVEFALLVPWIYFLFIGALDVGLYAYASVNVHNAARQGALYASSSAGAASDAQGACSVVRQELQALPNFGATDSACSALPLLVSVQSLGAGADGDPAASVTVTYQTIDGILMPGLPVRMTLTQTVQMRLRTD